MVTAAIKVDAPDSNSSVLKSSQSRATTTTTTTIIKKSPVSRAFSLSFSHGASRGLIDHWVDPLASHPGLGGKLLVGVYEGGGFLRVILSSYFQNKLILYLFYVAAAPTRSIASSNPPASSFNRPIVSSDL